jgi:hypothetical protein
MKPQVLVSSCGHCAPAGPGGVKAKPFGRAVRGLDPAGRPEFLAAKRKPTETKPTSRPWWDCPKETLVSALEPVLRWGRPESARTFFATARIQHWVSDHNTIGTDRSFIRGLFLESDTEPPAGDVTKEVNRKRSLTTKTT